MTVSAAPCLLVDLRLAHAVADHLAAAELHLLAIDGEILLDLDDEIGVGKPHPVAGGGPEHVGIDGTFDFRAHSVLLASLHGFVEHRDRARHCRRGSRRRPARPKRYSRRDRRAPPAFGSGRMRARILLILSAILISLALGDLCGASTICSRRRSALGRLMSSVHFDDERGDALAEFFRQFLARGLGVLDACHAASRPRRVRHPRRQSPPTAGSRPRRDD